VQRLSFVHRRSDKSLVKSHWISDVLTAGWRDTAAPTNLSQLDLASVSTLILGSGAGALGWAKLRNSELHSCAAAIEFQQAYRHHTIEAAIHERDIKQVFGLLRSHGIEPVLVKGWSVARLYPEKGLRPYDDTDIVVRPADWSKAQAVISAQVATHFSVDLHRGFEELDDRSNHDLFSDSQLVELGDVAVRVLRPEDSLRIICLHLLHHGAFRPLWLCDVAVAVESRPGDFDWDRCLGQNKRVADWVACTIGLAHRLLGARIEDTPVKHRAESLPSWLVPTVLKQWENPFSKDHGVARHRAPMASYLRNPAGLFRDLKTRWPNPIEATINLRGSFNKFPRFPYQVGDCIVRATRFALNLPRSLKDPHLFN
jgi:hypothetical protein